MATTADRDIDGGGLPLPVSGGDKPTALGRPAAALVRVAASRELRAATTEMRSASVERRNRARALAKTAGARLEASRKLLDRTRPEPFFLDARFAESEGGRRAREERQKARDLRETSSQVGRRGNLRTPGIGGPSPAMPVVDEAQARKRRKALVGQNIKLRRRQLGMGQRELARRLEMDQTSLSAWENGRHEPSPLGMERLAMELEVPTAWFFELHGEDQL
jgi:ribosome-binding protein aMBF1 (putative translation factor)